MIICVDLDLHAFGVAPRQSNEIGGGSVALDNWPWVKFIQSVYVEGGGADASGKAYPEPVDDRKILSYGYDIAPRTPSEGYLVNAESQSLTIANRAVTIFPGGSFVAFWIYNYSGAGPVQVSAKMKINGPARGCISKHIGPFPGGTLISAPDEQHPIEVPEGDSVEIGPESADPQAIIRVFWIGTEFITGWPRDLASGIYCRMTA